MYNADNLNLELRIDAAARKFLKEPTKEQWQVLADLIMSRSPERVAEMEHQKGLS
jgi:hypothetical protein